MYKKYITEVMNVFVRRNVYYITKKDRHLTTVLNLFSTMYLEHSMSTKMEQMVVWLILKIKKNIFQIEVVPNHVL